MDIKTKRIATTKTARYYLHGEPGPAIREVWFVLHGYGQLAGEFLENFIPLSCDFRLLVAVEALSRFYTAGGSGRIGASWMTREDREQEIADNILYLDRVYAETLAPMQDNRLHITILGFSQGTATACRWSLLGHSPCHRLILWGGDFPADIQVEHCRTRLEKLELHLVNGDKDPYVKPTALGEQFQWLKEKQIPFQHHTFSGFHEIAPEPLLKLATLGT